MIPAFIALAFMHMEYGAEEIIWSVWLWSQTPKDRAVVFDLRDRIVT